jgi:hypothetical protein
VDGGVSTGTGTVTVKVEKELRYSANIKQGAYAINVIDYLRLGENRVDLTITDFRGNSKSILFIVSMYDPDALVSTKLVERTLTGDYTNDRVTRVGDYAFYGLTFETLELPNATELNGYSVGCKATELELSSATKITYMMFNGCDIGVVKLPSVVQAEGRCLDAAKIKRIVFNSLETMGGDMAKIASNIKIFDFHKLTTLWDLIPGNNIEFSIIIRTPTVCTLQSEATNTKVTLYVPEALLADYKASTNWVTMADRIFAIEEHPEICGGE